MPEGMFMIFYVSSLRMSSARDGIRGRLHSLWTSGRDACRSIGILLWRLMTLGLGGEHTLAKLDTKGMNGADGVNSVNSVLSMQLSECWMPVLTNLRGLSRREDRAARARLRLVAVGMI
jgi:hypothetical protein